MEIKPCPSCGSDKKLRVGGPIFSKMYVVCNNCGAYGPNGDNKDEAIEYWNAAPRKEDAEMEKSCRNCKYLKLGTKIKNKWYCTKALEDEYSGCKSWAPHNPFKPTQMTVCSKCQYEYWDNGEHYCGKAIWNLDYSCPGWEAKEPESAPLNSSKSSSLDELCLAAVEKWGATAQIYKTIEELSELITALARYQNADENSDDAILSAADNVREEREDVEIMLLQLDAMFGRSEAWRREKYEHLREIVKNKEE